MTIPERLSMLIRDSGYTYERLEELTGIPKSNLQRYASGNTKKIPIDAVERVAPFLDSSAAYILGWTQEKPDASYIADTELNDRAEALFNACKHFTEDDWGKLLDYAHFLISKHNPQA